MDSAYISVPEFTEVEERVKKKIYNNCLRKVYSKYCMENIKEKLRNNEFSGTDLQKVYDEAQALRSEDSKDQYYFITICPYEDLELDKFLKVMEKVLKKKWFQRYIYVYEQRQHEIGKQYFGLHTHIIVQRDGIAKSDVIREIYNTCKTIVGSKQSIDVKLLKTQHDLDVKLNYILGKKATEEKQKKQVIDKKFREDNNLQPFYSLGEWDLSKYINIQEHI
jgi:hypothetical protein